MTVYDSHKGVGCIIIFAADFIRYETLYSSQSMFVEN